MESDFSDGDDYAPIAVSAWGDQAQHQQQHDDNGLDDYPTSTSQDPTKIDTNGWAQIIDPEAKKLAGALGSGGLHRQGKNYKPIAEELIISQRKGIVIPKPKGTKKTRASRSNSKQAAPASSADHRKFSRSSDSHSSTTTTTTFSKSKKHQPIPAQSVKPPSLSTIRRPPPPSSSGQSGWGAQPLVEIPFWEKQKDISPLTGTTTPTNTTMHRHPTDKRKNSKQLPASEGSSTSIHGFDSHKPAAATTISPPPGFGPIPQRQYPVKMKSKSQPPPPPGYDYADISAQDSPTSLPSDNNSNSQLRPWAVNDQSKELWKRMDEGLKMNEQSSNNNKLNGNSKKDHGRVSGGNDASVNRKPPSRQSSQPPSQDDVSSNHGWDTLPSTIKNNTWNSSSFSKPNINTDQGWGTADLVTPYDDDATRQQTPMEFIDEQMAGFTKGRFSNPHKSKYSSTSDQDHGKHLPRNYYARNGTSRPAFMEAPAKVALPPPSHNPVVISIHLELDNGNKIPIPIRKLDQPEVLARSFCQSQNITNPALINGITNLFAQQKSTAMQRYNRS